MRLLDRPFPQNIEELRVVSCKIGPLVSASFCNQLSVKCNLRKLALVQTQLSNKSTQDLCQIIKQSRFLIDLDLSWNEMTSSSMMVLAQAISENRQL